MWASYMPIILNETKAGGVTETAYFLNYAERVQYLLPDVLGAKTMFTCENETGVGLEGFTRKMENIATSMSNAYVPPFSPSPSLQILLASETT